jgi:hypothetical protein
MTLKGENQIMEINTENKKLLFCQYVESDVPVWKIQVYDLDTVQQILKDLVTKAKSVKERVPDTSVTVSSEEFEIEYFWFVDGEKPCMNDFEFFNVGRWMEEPEAFIHEGDLPEGLPSTYKEKVKYSISTDDLSRCFHPSPTEDDFLWSFQLKGDGTIFWDGYVAVP